MSFIVKNRISAMVEWRKCDSLEKVVDWHLKYTPWMGRDVIVNILPKLYSEKLKKAIIENNDVSEVEEPTEFEQLMFKMTCDKLS